MSNLAPIVDADDLIKPLITAMREHLLADQAFSGPPAVEVLVEEQSDFLQQVDANLNGRTGLCVIVAVPEIRGADHDDQLIVSPVVQIYENVLQNQSDRGTKRTARGLALRAYVLLRGLSAGGWSALKRPSGGSGKGWFPDINVAPYTSGPGGFDGTNVRSGNTSNRIATGALHSILITSTQVFVDGSEVSGYKDTGTLGTVATTQLGTRSDFVNYFAFDLVEYAVFNGTPSAGDRTSLHSWAVSEYGAP